jgi:hypothetical protein
MNLTDASMWLMAVTTVWYVRKHRKLALLRYPPPEEVEGGTDASVAPYRDEEEGKPSDMARKEKDWLIRGAGWLIGMNE